QVHLGPGRRPGLRPVALALFAENGPGQAGGDSPRVEETPGRELQQLPRLSDDPLPPTKPPADLECVDKPPGPRMVRGPVFDAWLPVPAYAGGTKNLSHLRSTERQRSSDLFLFPGGA